MRNVALPDGRTGHDVLVAQGRIVSVAPRIDARAARTVQGDGHLLSAPFVGIGTVSQ